MDIQSVPQDNSETYASMKKAIYASDEEGKLTTVGSSGWEVEEIATKAALEEIENGIVLAYEAVKSGQKSPLYYHMNVARMDLLVLAQSTGFFQWTIKRDFEPKKFKNLSEKRLLAYCDVLGVTPEAITQLPEVCHA
jgi:vancomycin resistance protein YoaR